MPIIQVNGTALSYQDSGPKDAPTILFSHSLFFDRRMFDHQVEAFSDRYRVVTYDQRGHGDSPHPNDGRYDMDTLTDDAAALIKELDLGPVHAVGNSMGGFVTLRLGARYPELVRSVTAIGSSAEEEYNVEQYQPLVEALKALGVEPLIDNLLYTMFGDTTLANPGQAELLNTWRDRMIALPLTISDAAYAVVNRSTVAGELARILVPVLAVAGAEDHAYSAELSQNIARLAPVGSYALIDAAGHSASLEAPEPVNRVLAAHFKKAEEDYAA